MHAIQHLLNRARARLMFQDMITLTGALALAGIALGTLALLVERLLAIWLGGPWPILILSVLGATAGIFWALFRRQQDETVAVAVDERLGLKDRIASALHFVDQADQHPFARQIVDEAELAATTAQIEKCFPYKAPKAWAWVPVLLILAGCIHYFVAQRDLLGIQARRDQAAAEQVQAQVIEENVQEALKAVKEIQATLPPTDDGKDKATDEALAKTGSMGDNTDRPESQKEAVAELADLQKKLDATASQAEKEVTALKNALTNLQTSAASPADQFADALRRGDFDAAQTALQQITQNTQGMTADEKKALSEQFQNLGQQLQQIAQEQQQQQQEQQQNQPQQNPQNQPNQNQQQQAQNQQQQQQQQQNQQNQPQQQQQNQQQAQNQQNQNQQQQQQQQQNQQQNQQPQQQQNQQAQNQQNPNQGNCAGACNNLGQGLQQMAQQMQQPGQNPGQAQQPGQGQQQPQGQQNAQQALQQMAQMQNQLQQMKKAQQAAQQAMNQNLNQGQGQKQAAGAPGAQGGKGWGTGYSGPTAGPESRVENYQTEAVSDGASKDGRIIASWLENGENAKGEAKVMIDQQVTKAQRSADQAVSESRIPGKYQQSVRNYFDQIPETVEQSRAPQAPR